MILVLGGTYDSRMLVEALLKDDHNVVYSSVTQFNTSLLPADNRLTLHIEAMNVSEMESFIRNRGISYIVDATHPYAEEVSVNAITAANTCHVPYLRLERPGLIEDGKHFVGFDTYEEMVAFLEKKQGNILVTTGSRQLEYYQQLNKNRLTIRVLPSASVLAKCEALGYKPSAIIAMQGPFTKAMNELIIEERRITYLTTKDSGNVGGVAEKLSAAKDKGVMVLFLRRPKIDYPKKVHAIDEVIEELKEKYE